MALFSGRREVYVGTQVTRVIEDSLLPQLPATSIVTAILRDQNLTRTLLDDINGGFGKKSDRAFKYARDGGYTIGLPQHSFVNTAVGVDEVKTELEILHGGPVDITYHHFAAPNNIHIGLQVLTDVYGYDESTNQIDALTGTYGYPVYLESIEGTIDSRVNAFENPLDIPIAEPTVWDLAVWDTKPNARFTPWYNIYEGDPVWGILAENSRTTVFFAYEDGASEIQRGNFEIPMGSYLLTAGYFQTKYTYDLSGTPKVKYFTYRYKSGGYPNIDATAIAVSDIPEFMPVAFFRQSATDITAPSYRDGQDYITTKKLLNKLGMNYQEISDDIHANEDIAEIQDAILVYGVPIDTELDSGKKYLFHFFDWLLDTDTSLVLETNDNPLTFPTKLASLPVNHSITLEDQNFKLSLEFGAVGSEIFASSTTVGSVFVTVFYEEVTHLVFYNTTVDDQPVRTSREVTDTVSVHRFTKQLTPTTAQRISIAGLKTVYTVYGKESEINSSGDKGRLLIPINYHIVKDNFTLMERDGFYASALHLVFNSKVSQYIPWYATSIFQSFIKAIAIIITVVTIGQAAPAVQAAYIGYAALYGTLAAAVIVALQYLAVNYAIQRGFSFLAAEIGAENTGILAVIAVIGSIYGQRTDATWAPTLMRAASNLTDAANTQVALELADIVEQSAEFTERSEELTAELEEAQALLGEGANMDLLAVYNQVPQLILGESPDDFYSRTTGVGNVGVLAYDYIENYVEISLRLPTFADTINGFNHDK